MDPGWIFPFLQHGEIGRFTIKIVPDMTYNVFGGTLNPTLLYGITHGSGK